MPIQVVIGIIITVGVGLVSVLVTLYLSRQTTANQGQLRQLISRITGLFAASQRVGIETAYEDRGTALAPRIYDSAGATSFVSRFQTEKKLVVVGSSLLGLRMYVQHLPEILSSRAERKLETRFMLTHPCFSRLREDQEGREEEQIRKEIEETVRYLEGCGMANDDCLRFYRGTPTCFAVITSNSMLLNPYPYQIEAFRCFCVEVRRLPQDLCPGRPPGEEDPARPLPPQIDSERFAEAFRERTASEGEKEYDYSMDIGPDIYGQFYWFHYLLPWFSRQAVTFSEFRDVCTSCDCLKDGYSKEKCNLRQQRPQGMGPFLTQLENHAKVAARDSEDAGREQANGRAL